MCSTSTKGGRGHDVELRIFAMRNEVVLYRNVNDQFDECA
jgi:hypothetical protein